MELKPGYKQTEVGVIPEDWSVVRLSVLISELNAGVSVNSVDEKLGLYGHTESVLKTSCILDGYFFPEECKKILPGDIGRAKLNPTKDSIVISRMNTPALVGECGYVDKDYSYLFLPDRLWQTIIRKEAGVNVRWLAYLLSFGQFSKAIKDTATGTSGSMKNISKEIFLGLQVVFPDRREQTAIANALSDADALIQSLTRLIAKKRQIKQGAMQTLLNPYENGQLKAGWEVKKMPEVCWFQEGPGVRNSQFTRSGVKLLNGTNIDQGELFLDKTDRYISEKEAYGWYSHFLADEGDIIIACSGITVEKFHEKVTVLRKEHLPLCMNTSTMRFKVISKELLHNYLIHFLRSRVFKEQIGGKATGSAQLNFGPSHVNAVEMALPPINEQTRITAILSDMDAEIAALEAKLAKYRQIKQGMMQNLLTGRIRLI